LKKINLKILAYPFYYKLVSKPIANYTSILEQESI